MPFSAPYPFDAPTGAIAQTFSRGSAVGNGSVLTTTDLYLTLIWLPVCTVTSVTYISATTALSGGSNQWFGIFDASLNLLKLTSDDTSTAWAANTAKTLNLSTTLAVTTAGLYYVGIMVKATTVPTLATAQTSSGAAAVGLAPIVHGNSSTGLTNPASCPNPAGAITAGGPTPYAYVS